MAKKKSSKKSTKSLVMTIVVMVFGALLFTTMFIPMFETALGGAVSIADIIGEEVSLGDTLDVASWTGFIASLIGAAIFLFALLSLVLKGKLFDNINLILGIGALLLSVVSLICTFVFIGDMNGEYIKAYSISAAGFVALGSSILAPILTKLK